MLLRANVSSIPALDPVDITLPEERLYARFLQEMDKLGPFEEFPHIAVGVSGGGDSMALIRFVLRWAQSCQATVVALTVDHGLRGDSRQEAETVGGWLKELAVPHYILSWKGDKPATQIQAAARKARYALMEDWCAANHFLHLCVGHTSNDQAETYLMRESHGSGNDGLAGMSQILELHKCRVLRPLLTMNRDELRQFLKQENATWAEDPSNENETFERVRWRRHMAKEQMPEAGLHAKASHYGQLRITRDQELTRLIADAVAIHPFGYAHISHVRLADISRDTYVGLMARVLSVIGGRPYAPSLRRMDELLPPLSDSVPPSITLNGCQMSWKTDGVFITREKRGLPPAVSIQSGSSIHWDNRFRMEFGDGLLMCQGTAVLRPMEDADWPIIKANIGPQQLQAYRLEVCRSLPVIADDTGLVAMPHLGFVRDEKKKNQNNASETVRFLSFYPLHSLSGAGFAVA